MRQNQLQNNVCDAVDDGHGGAVDTDAGIMERQINRNSYI